MSKLKYNTFEELQKDEAVKALIEYSEGVEIEVVGITFFVRDAGEHVKIYKMGRDGWLFAGKYSKQKKTINKAMEVK